MFCHTQFHPTREKLAALAIVVLLALNNGAADGGEPGKLRIGLADTFLREKSSAVIDIAREDFKHLMQKTTGLGGEVSTKFTAFEIAERLLKKELDLGIFHGHEFAWVQKTHADLEPRIVAINRQHEDRAYVIVHKNEPAKTFGELRGKKFDLPKGVSETSRVFVAKLCADSGEKDPRVFFAPKEKSVGPVAALDAVASGKAHATVVNTSWLEFYKDEKGPTFTSSLRVLTQSEAFPPAVIAVKKGALVAEMLKQFQDGVIKAHNSESGRQMMKEWNIDAFEAVPKDYDKRLAEVLKAYPPPQ